MGAGSDEAHLHRGDRLPSRSSRRFSKVSHFSRQLQEFFSFLFRTYDCGAYPKFLCSLLIFLDRLHCVLCLKISTADRKINNPAALVECSCVPEQMICLRRFIPLRMGDRTS